MIFEDALCGWIIKKITNQYNSLSMSPYFAFFTVIALIFLSCTLRKEVFSSRNRSCRKSDAVEFKTEEKASNISAMRKVVAAHDGDTAEILGFPVYGRQNVAAVRRIYPGNRIELRKGKDDLVKVYSSGKSIGELSIPECSYIPQILLKGIPFDAYLGGRDMDYIYDDYFDSCSIIVFYKLKGVPPTKVKLS